MGITLIAVLALAVAIAALILALLAVLRPMPVPVINVVDGRVTDIVATIESTVLAGGAIRFEGDDFGRVIADFDGRGPFRNIPGKQLIWTAQLRHRNRGKVSCG